jgi:hypothetical protein
MKKPWRLEYAGVGCNFNLCPTPGLSFNLDEKGRPELSAGLWDAADPAASHRAQHRGHSGAPYFRCGIRRKGTQRSKLKVHARMWILSRLAPKRFGEKPEPDDELIRDCDLPQSGEFFSIFVRGHTNGESRWPGDFGHLQAASETEAAELIFGRPTLRSIPAARRNRTRYSMAR